MSSATAMIRALSINHIHFIIIVSFVFFIIIFIIIIISEAHFIDSRRHINQ